MKKIYLILLSLASMMLLAACGNYQGKEADQRTDLTTQETEISEIRSEKNETQQSNILIAYFGRRGNTEFPDEVDAASSASIVPGKEGGLQGTTEYTASLIQQKIGGDLYLIQTAEPYPADYDAVVEQNHQEQEDGTIPELSSVIEDMEQYDTVFIGYPIWATSLPQPVVSFLHQYDLYGKTIIPFCTHAGYGSGNSYMKIREICPDAQVLEGLAIEAEEIGSAETEISRWLEMLQSGSDEMQGTVSSSECIPGGRGDTPFSGFYHKD